MLLQSNPLVKIQIMELYDSCSEGTVRACPDIVPGSVLLLVNISWRMFYIARGTLKVCHTASPEGPARAGLGEIIYLRGATSKLQAVILPDRLK